LIINTSLHPCNSCIMLKMLNSTDEPISPDKDWLNSYWIEFRRRLVSLLGYQFRQFPASLSLNLLQRKGEDGASEGGLSRKELAIQLNNGDLKRLELYSQNMVDHHLITDLLPTVARLFFTGRFGILSLSPAQRAILLGEGLQYKSVETMTEELNLPANQLLALFNKSIKKIVTYLNGICERAIEEKVLGPSKVVKAMPTKKSLQEDLDEVEEEFRKDQEQAKRNLQESTDFSKYAIRGTEEDWQSALDTTSGSKNKLGILSVKGSAKKKRSLSQPDFDSSIQKAGKKKKFKHKK